MKTLTELFGITQLYKDHVMTREGVLARVYEIKGLNLLFFNKEKLASYLYNIELFLNSLSIQINVQVMVDITWQEKDNISFYKNMNHDDDVEKVLCDDTIDHESKRSYRQKRIYLTATVVNEKVKKGLFQRDYEAIQSPEEQIESLSVFEKESLSFLKDITFKHVKAKHVYDLLFLFMNPEKARYAMPSYREEDEKELLDQVAHSPIINNKEYVQIGKCYFKTLNIEFCPVYADFSFFYELDFDFDYRYAISFQKVNPDPHIKKLTIKRNILSSSSGLVADLMGVSTSGSEEFKSEQAIEEIMETVKQVSRQEQALFECRISLTVEAGSAEDCDRYAKLVERKWQSIHKTHAIIDDYNHLDNMMSIFPSQYQKNESRHLIMTQPLTFLLPFEKSFQGTDHKEILLRNQHDELFSFSFSKSGLTSAHSIVVAPTGKGKSFTINYVIKELLLNTKNTYISIIDKGGSYRKLALLLNGHYLDLALEERYAINPFPAKDIFLKDGDFDRSLLVFLRQFLILAVTEENSEPIKAYQEQVLDESIVLFYEAIADQKEPLLGDYVTFIETQFEKRDDPFIKECVKGLRFYVDEKSAYAILLNRPSQLDLDHRFVVFDTTNMKDHPRLQRLYFFLINYSIQLKMMRLVKEGVQQLVIFDEAWKILESAQTASLVETLYREARRYGTKICCISQSAKDFTENQNVKIIPENAQIKMVLHHDQDKVKGLAELGLNEKECQVITQMKEKRDIFFKAGQNSTVLKLEASKMDIEICSTDSESLKKYQPICERGDKSGLIKELTAIA